MNKCAFWCENCELVCFGPKNLFSFCVKKFGRDVRTKRFLEQDETWIFPVSEAWRYESHLPSSFLLVFISFILAVRGPLNGLLLSFYNPLFSSDFCPFLNDPRPSFLLVFFWLSIKPVPVLGGFVLHVVQMVALLEILIL